MADDGTTDAPVQTAPEPQDPPAQPTTPSAATEPAADDFVRVPRDQLSDYGGDFHRALGDAKTGRQMTAAGATDLMAACSDLGITPQELAQSIMATKGVTAEGEQPPALEAPTEPEQQPLTADSVREAIQQGLQEYRDSDTDAAAEQAVQNFALQTIQGEGLNFNDDGSPGVLMQQGWNMIYSAIHQAKAAELPSWLSDEERTEAMNRPASQTALQTAGAEFKKIFADLGNEFNSKAVTQQQDIPGATNGAGPAGQPPKKPWDQMTFEEQQADALGSAKDKIGPPG